MKKVNVRPEPYIQIKYFSLIKEKSRDFSNERKLREYLPCSPTLDEWLKELIYAEWEFITLNTDIKKGNVESTS